MYKKELDKFIEKHVEGRTEEEVLLLCDAIFSKIAEGNTLSTVSRPGVASDNIPERIYEGHAALLLKIKDLINKHHEPMDEKLEEWFS